MTSTPPPDSPEAMRRQLARMGQKVLKMQMQVESANRSRRRAESLLRVLSATYESAEHGVALEARSEVFARSVLDMVRARRVLLLEREGADVRILAALGYDADPSPEGLSGLPWDRSTVYVGEAEPEPSILTALTGQHRVLWVAEAEMSLAMVVSSAPAGLRWPSVEPDDGPLVQSALRVFGLLRSREAEAQSLRHARTAAQQASEAKSRFLANMSHEIRTPMSGVLGVAEEMLEWALEPRVRQRVQTIHDSGLVLLGVLNDILDLSKVEAGRVELDAQPVELPRLVEDVVALFSPRAELRGLQLRRSDGSLPEWVELDPVRVRQVLSNLLGNAVKFTDRGFVDFGVRFEPEGERRGRIIAVVEDSGVGMSPEVAEKVFEPFVQAKDANDRRHTGTGLGLSICSELVRLMGGQIRFDSELGQGTRFEVSIPCRVVEPPEADRDGPGVLRDLPSLRVLVAEDDRTNQLVSQRLLERMGHSVELVEDGFAAVRAVSERPFDIVLMDVQMPGCDGLEASRILRAGGAGPRGETLPIVALTAHALSMHRDECLAAGMNGHVSKPVRREQLEEELLRVLEL